MLFIRPNRDQLAVDLCPAIDGLLILIKPALILKAFTDGFLFIGWSVGGQNRNTVHCLAQM